MVVSRSHLRRNRVGKVEMRTWPTLVDPLEVSHTPLSLRNPGVSSYLARTGRARDRGAHEEMSKPVDNTSESSID
jgi:hypothetical protein